MGCPYLEACELDAEAFALTEYKSRSIALQDDCRRILSPRIMVVDQTRNTFLRWNPSETCDQTFSASPDYLASKTVGRFSVRLRTLGGGRVLETVSDRGELVYQQAFRVGHVRLVLETQPQQQPGGPDIQRLDVSVHGRKVHPTKAK